MQSNQREYPTYLTSVSGFQVYVYLFFQCDIIYRVLQKVWPGYTFSDSVRDSWYVPIKTQQRLIVLRYGDFKRQTVQSEYLW